MEMPLPPSVRQLCSVQMLLLVTIAALDSADKSLLAASFPVLEKQLGLSMEALGYFSLFSNLSYALSLPFWAYLVHYYSIANAHNILATACILWGMAAFGIASTSTFFSQALYRSMNGAALASILPLSQTMLAELVPSNTRGRAFGVLGLFEKAAATVAVASVVWYNDNWRRPYVIVGVLSVTIALLARRKLQISTTSNEKDTSTSSNVSLFEIVKRLSRLPAFACLVGQGVFGAIPWDTMSFLLLLLDWKGFNKEQVVMIQFTNGVSGTIGGLLGGLLGDVSAQQHGMLGRIAVAFVSVVGGTVFYGLFLFSNSYLWTLLWSNLFQLWGGWTPAATNRPLCAELAKNPSERAQIVAAWILLEKTSAAVFGAPLVGYITKHMLSDEGDSTTDASKAETLTFNMFCLSSFFWAVCAAFWLLMAHLMRKQESYEVLNQEKGKMQA